MSTFRLRITTGSALERESESTTRTQVVDAARADVPELLEQEPVASPEALKLSSRLQALASENDRFILVAGFNEKESSAEIAMQLSAGLSEINGQSVLLVDGNLRNPWLHNRFGVDVQPGLTNVLGKNAGLLTSAIRVITPTLAVLPAGNSRPDSSLFASTDFSDLLECQLRPRFRFIILNSAPFSQFVDASLIASRADGVVITLTSGRHSRTELLDLKNELESLKAKIFGTVLCEAS
jgi:Mrp family chromosome partitioning ATPase